MDPRSLDGESYAPLYRQLMDRIREDIAAGLYPVNTRIPSEQELCTAYSVSRVTVRKALDELTQEGLLQRRQGKGTFVSVPRLFRDLKHVNSFQSTCRMMGRSPSTRVLRSELIPAEERDLSQQLAKPGDSILETVRLRMADDKPVMLETNHFPHRYAWLMAEDLSQSLYALLHLQRIEPRDAIHEISLVYADEEEAPLLGVTPGSALLQLEQLIFDQDGRPLHSSRQLIRGDQFTFRI